MAKPVRIVFLGGLGEIGRNCLCLEIGGRILVVDCGLMFPTEDMPGVDLVLPDIRYLQERAERIDAVVLTHGHEDHIGALPYLLRHLDVPVYGSELTIGILSAKLAEARIAKPDLRVFADGEDVSVGVFRFRTIPVTHSTPQAVGLAFTTPQGVIVHSGDFKIDPTPVDGRLTDLPTFGTLGAAGVRLLLSDSTNAEHDDYTGSESQVGRWLADLFARHTDGRIIAACFASHLHRVQQICDAAVASGRVVAFLGRSMLANTQLARSMGLLDVPDDAIIDVDAIDALDPSRVCVICTGSQGEPLAALSLMAAGDHRSVTVGEDDTVIISATPIPGNEMNVHRAIDGLLRAGADVVYSDVADVHVSGHAGALECKALLGLLRPEFFVPVHGEYRHLVAHAKLAVAMQVPEEHVLLAEDGDVLELTDDGLEFADSEAPAGYVYVDGSGVGEITTGVLRDRRRLADDGSVVCVVGVDAHSGEVVRGPEVMSHGFVAGVDEDDFAKAAAGVVNDAIARAAGDGALDLTTLNRRVRQSLGKFAQKRYGRRPIVFPIVIEV